MLRVSASIRGFSTASANALSKPVFFDMKHSNNAARVRLWIRLKGMSDKIDSRMVTYPDLQTPEFAAVNPLKKVPAFILENGDPVIESAVILGYLEDRYGDCGPSFTPDTPEGRQRMNLFIRMHDLYLASPNCTQPNFAHTQGCMYLAPYQTAHCTPERTMDRPTRAAKLAELWKQLSWIDANADATQPYLVANGGRPTLADFTVFPTMIFCEFMLPRVFKWAPLLRDEQSSPLPNLARWYSALIREDEAFATVHKEIWDVWVAKEEEGQFDSIIPETNDPAFKWVYP